MTMLVLQQMPLLESNYAGNVVVLVLLGKVFSYPNVIIWMIQVYLDLFFCDLNTAIPFVSTRG